MEESAADRDLSKLPTILCVDDEPNILASLKRLCRKIDCRILTATSGESALAILKENQAHVAMVIADQRMPKMTGAELLRQVKELAPDTIRILLTGYADVPSAIAAINNAGLYGYFPKPWNDDEFLSAVSAGLAHYDLIQQNKRLLDQTRRQNAELITLNETLEQRVAERTEALERRNQELTRLSELLEKDLFESLSMLLLVMEGHSLSLVRHARRVAVLVQRLGPVLGVPEPEVKAMVTAALLHDLGLIEVPHEILIKPEALLSEAERTLLQRHPRVGTESLCQISRLKNVVPIILSHHERFDGRGYPQGIKGEEIPLGARILAVAEGYDHAVAPSYGMPIAALVPQALESLKSGRGESFDPAVVDGFIHMITAPAEGKQPLPFGDSREGIVPAKDLYTPQTTL
jgi:response regulator RpfG family c-di-GMP phosphodiesterase